jgi:hypothetical protein
MSHSRRPEQTDAHMWWAIEDVIEGLIEYAWLLFTTFLRGVWYVTKTLWQLANDR